MTVGQVAGRPMARRSRCDNRYGISVPVNAARALRDARCRAGMSQRHLADATGVAQPAIARIEAGSVVPRIDTLDRLLAGCGAGLEVTPRLGAGIERDTIRAALRLSPGERLRMAAEDLGTPDSKTPSFRPSLMLDALVRGRVRFVLIGGLAARLRGAPMVTDDVDVCHARDPRNVRLLGRVLAGLASARAPRAEDLAGGGKVSVTTGGGRLDLIGSPAGVEGFEELKGNAGRLDLGTLTVPVASIDALIRMKRASPSHPIELEILGALREELDRPVAR